MNKDKVDLELIKYGLQEIKDQYKLFLEGFDDVKKKNQVLLVVCSLFITLPFANPDFIQKIMSLNIFKIAFLYGVFLLTYAIILLIISMRETQLEIPKFQSFLDAIGRYKTKNIMKSMMKKYSSDLDTNIKRVDKKRWCIRIAEIFIFIGILLITTTFFWIIIVR